MELFGLSPIEMVVVVVAAILVFGGRLPQVAGEAAATLQKVKRSLTDLRRDTGIDQELTKAKREYEEAQRKARALDVAGAVKREVASARQGVRDVLTSGQEAPTATVQPVAPALADTSTARSATQAPSVAPKLDAPTPPDSAEASDPGRG